MTTDRDTSCAHCGDPIREDPPGWWSHIIGLNSVLRRCDPAKSGQPYGLDATPEEPRDH